MAIDDGRCAKQLRRETRMKVMLSGELSVRGTSVTCRVHDISRGGACLEIDGRAVIGDEVRFARGQLVASGRIAWIRGKRCGVRFHRPIRATDLLVQMSHSRQARSAAEVPLFAAEPDQPSLAIQVSNGRTGKIQPMPTAM